MSYPFPNHVLPACFKDEKKLAALYSPIRSSEVNPEDRDIKCNFWKNSISLSLSCTSEYTFTPAAMKRKFFFNGIYPSSLNTVLDEMINSGELVCLDVFLEQPSISSWSGYFADILLKKPVSWTWSKLVKSDTKKLDQQTFVYLDVLKNESGRLLLAVPEKFKNRAIYLNTLLESTKASFPNLSAHNAKILIHYLVREGKADLRMQNNAGQVTHIVKLSDTLVKPINDCEAGIFKLEEEEQKLLGVIEKLEDELKECEDCAREEVKKKHKQLALTYLKKKYNLEKRIVSKTGALQNIRAMLEKLKDSETNESIIESYRNTLRIFEQKYNNYDQDEVPELMNQVGEQVDIHEDLQSTLAKPIDDVDMEELEKELDDLVKKEEEAEEVKRIEDAMKNLTLPSEQKAQPSLNTAPLAKPVP